MLKILGQERRPLEGFNGQGVQWTKLLFWGLQEGDCARVVALHCLTSSEACQGFCCCWFCFLRVRHSLRLPLLQAASQSLTSRELACAGGIEGELGFCHCTDCYEGHGDLMVDYLGECSAKFSCFPRDAKGVFRVSVGFHLPISATLLEGTRIRLPFLVFVSAQA